MESVEVRHWSHSVDVEFRVKACFCPKYGVHLGAAKCFMDIQVNYYYAKVFKACKARYRMLFVCSIFTVS